MRLRSARALTERNDGVKVLLVDNDTAAAEELAAFLLDRGMDVDVADCGCSALENFRSADVVLLELMLPDMDGFQVCHTIRLHSQVPILAVTSRNDEFDHVLALKMGADEYVVKPYRHRELSARIEANMRRMPGARGVTAAPPGSDVRIVGDMTINVRSHRVTIEDREVRLTPKEFDLLALLSTEPGRIFTRQQIVTRLWGGEKIGDSRTLGVHMTNLRKKISRPGLIKTVHGVGFRMAADHDW